MKYVSNNPMIAKNEPKPNAFTTEGRSDMKLDKLLAKKVSKKKSTLTKVQKWTQYK